MSCIERGRAKVLAWGLAMACVIPAFADEPPWPESDTVLDLLRADARAASAGKQMERAQDWLAMPNAATQRPVAPVPGAQPSAGAVRDQIDVLAIYGVGRALHADIAINGELWRYRQGRRWPQGVNEAGGEPRYSLAGIEQPCVRLLGGDAQRTVCLHSGRGSGDE